MSDKILKPANTNLACEFFVLSCLHNLGVNAYLTMGNEKSVDIVVVKNQVHAITIDVKGLWYGLPFLMGNKIPFKKENHYYILVRLSNRKEEIYENKVEELKNGVSNLWVYPSLSLPYKETNGKGFVINRRDLTDSYLYNFSFFLDE